jgi:hypothetical protein
MQSFTTRAMQVVRALRQEFKHSGRSANADPESVRTHMKMVIQNARGDQYENTFSKHEQIMSTEHELLMMFRALSKADDVAKVPRQMASVPPGIAPPNIPKVQQSGPPSTNPPQRGRKASQYTFKDIPDHPSGEPWVRPDFDEATRRPVGVYNLGTPAAAGNRPCHLCLGVNPKGGPHWMKDCPDDKGKPAAGGHVASVTMNSASVDGSNAGFTEFTGHYTAMPVPSVLSVRAPDPLFGAYGNNADGDSTQAYDTSDMHACDATFEEHSDEECLDWDADRHFLQVDGTHGSIAIKQGNLMPPTSGYDCVGQMRATELAQTCATLQHEVDVAELQRLAACATQQHEVDVAELQRLAASVVSSAGSAVSRVQAVSIACIADAERASVESTSQLHTASVGRVVSTECAADADNSTSTATVNSGEELTGSAHNSGTHNCLACSLEHAAATSTSLSTADRERATVHANMVGRGHRRFRL